jgi:hypothetical protein
MRYRIEVTSENPLGDMAVVNAGQQIAQELDHDGTNQGSVVVVDACNGTEVAAWRFPTDDPPPAPDLDAQINATWDRLHAEQATMYVLALRRIAATVLAKYPTAATLRLVICHPDESRMPDTWAVDEDGLRDADGQVVVEGDPAEVDDAIGEDLLTLGEMDQVYRAAVIDLRADPPELTVPDDEPPGT